MEGDQEAGEVLEDEEVGAIEAVGDLGDDLADVVGGTLGDGLGCGPEVEGAEGADEDVLLGVHWMAPFRQRMHKPASVCAWRSHQL